MSSIQLVQETRVGGDEAIRLLEDIVADGGPRETDYRALVNALDELHAADFVIQDGLSVRRADNPRLLKLIDDHPLVFKTTASMQGFARCKPHGYAGDFEIIERIYNHTVSNQPEVIRWDSFFHTGAAPWAVRNRASVLRALARQTEPRTMLSVGCGPGLDVIGAAGASPSLEAVTLLDNDPSAIRRATANTRHLSVDGLALTFVVKNALRYRPETSFDLIWSSGLFDYLNNKTACFLLRRLKDMLSPGGTLAVGNFGLENPSRSYMEIVGEWFLIHRSPTDLARLAITAGFAEEELRIEADATGLNLFLIATNR